MFIIQFLQSLKVHLPEAGLCYLFSMLVLHLSKEGPLASLALKSEVTLCPGPLGVCGGHTDEGMSLGQPPGGSCPTGMVTIPGWQVVLPSLHGAFMFTILFSKFLVSQQAPEGDRTVFRSPIL